MDCGSQRLNDFREASYRDIYSVVTNFLIIAEQLEYPGLKLSTLGELFDFVECVDRDHRMFWNIESKINADYPNRTRSVEDFVELQYEAFVSSPYLHQITVRGEKHGSFVHFFMTFFSVSKL